MQLRTQVKGVLSWPVVFTVTDDSPILLTVRVRGRSDVSGIIWIFMMSFGPIEFSVICA